MTYNAKEVCLVLGISKWTLTNWYQWERVALKSGEISQRELPVPIRLDGVKGKPRQWNSEQLLQLIEFQNNIVKGRNGRMGKVTNPKNRQKKSR